MKQVWERSAFVILSVVLALNVTGCSTRVNEGTRSIDGSASLAAEPTPTSLYDDGFFALYDENRSSGTPNYITPDLLAVAYTGLRRQSIQRKERGLWREQLAAVLSTLESGLLSQTASDVRTANVRFVMLLQALLHGTGDHLDEVAKNEYRLVMAADGISASPLDGVERDYSQFAPRGHYDGDAPSEQFFRAMRYASSAHFGVVPSAHTGVSAANADFNLLRARQLSSLLVATGAELSLATLIDDLQWHFGHTEDLTLVDIASIEGEAVFDYREAVLAFARDNNRVPAVFDSELYDVAGEQSPVSGDALIGWRLVPALAASDSRALQQLVYRGGSALIWQCEDCANPPSNAMRVNGKVVKAIPSTLELMALYGSELAESRHRLNGQQSFSDYARAREDASDALQQGQGLDALQHETLSAWSAPDTVFALNGGLGFWVLQKHAAMLYQKRSTTAVGKGFQGLEPLPSREGGVIARAPEAFSALAALADAHAQRNPEHTAFADLTRRCATLAAKQGGLSEADGEFLNRIDLDLKGLGLGDDAPVVVDVHNSGPRALLVATGYPRIWQLGSARGAGFSVYEFTRDRRELIDNGAWRALLSDPDTTITPIEFDSLENST